MVIIITLYDSKETNFNNNGLVVLNDCKSFFTTEKLNAEYEVELEYPLDTRGKWKYILEDTIVKNSEGQLFRIYNKNKTLSGIKANARHIFYDLLDNFLEDVRPTNISGYGALDWILTRTQYKHTFKSVGDVGGNKTRYFIRKNVVEAILGDEGIINTWGGEIVRDNFTIKLLQARGRDRGVLVAYGKNIKGIEETLDIDGVCTRLMPKGKDGLLLYEKYIDSPYINNFSHPKIRLVEFDDIEDEETLREVANEYMISNKIDVPIANYKIDFIELSKTEEYKNYAILEKVYLGDTVTIRHTKLGMDLKAKVISIKKNDLTNRIEEIELGSFKPNLSTSINNSIQEVKKEIEQSTTFLEGAINNATNQINNALGGYVIKRNGELLIMDTEDVMTATKVWRWNQGGLGYSSTGYNGPYATAITADGSIVANFINVGVLNAALIKAGLLKSFNGNSWINMEDGTLDLANGNFAWDGSKLTMVGKIINILNGYGIQLDRGGLSLTTKGENVGGLRASYLPSNESINGVTLTNLKNGDYIEIANTESDDFSGTVNFTPILRITKIASELMKNFKGIQLLDDCLIINGKKLWLESSTSDKNNWHEIYNSTSGHLCIFGDNGILLGYKNGNEKVTVFEIDETITNEIQAFIYKNLSLANNKIVGASDIFVGDTTGRYYNENWCGPIDKIAKRVSNINITYDSGWYAFGAGTNGAPCSYGTLFQLKWGYGDPTDCTQLVIEVGTGRLFTRSTTNNGAYWSSWIEK